MGNGDWELMTHSWFLSSCISVTKADVDIAGIQKETNFHVENVDEWLTVQSCVLRKMQRNVNIPSCVLKL